MGAFLTLYAKAHKRYNANDAQVVELAYTAA